MSKLAENPNHTTVHHLNNNCQSVIISILHLPVSLSHYLANMGHEVPEIKMPFSIGDFKR